MAQAQVVQVSRSECKQALQKHAKWACCTDLSIALREVHVAHAEICTFHKDREVDLDQEQRISRFGS